MAYAQLWVENQPTSTTQANTIWQFWQNNQIAIRERLDGLFGTNTWATSIQYQAATFDMRGSATPRIIGGATNWGIQDNTASFDNFIVSNTGNISWRGTNFVPTQTVTNFTNVAGNVNNLVINDNGTILIGNTLSIAAGGINVTGQGYSNQIALGNSGNALTINWNSGNNQTITLTGNCVFTLQNPVAGAVYVLILIQDAVGSRVPTWPANVHWPQGGSPPTLTTTPTKGDIITLYYDGANYLGNAGGTGYSV